jgi:hypothetical protein
MTGQLHGLRLSKGVRPHTAGLFVQNALLG